MIGNYHLFHRTVNYTNSRVYICIKALCCISCNHGDYAIKYITIRFDYDMLKWGGGGGGVGGRDVTD